MTSPRVCVIGAGPAGMSFLCSMKEAQREGKSVPEVVCYEKQADWGGMWNVTWRTGTDEQGELCHGSMYPNMWINVAKETAEFPDYSHEEHFKANIPSYQPGEVIYDYLKGYWSRFDVRSSIQFKKVVRHVTYSSESGLYSVQVFDLANNSLLPAELFTHLVVANGHFSVPNAPTFPGFDKFPGRILHSHDFRSAKEFTGRRVLVVGSSYSAEDLAVQCVKYGASSVIITWRSNPMNFKWPERIEERPLLQRMEGKTAHFNDGTSSDVDTIILCTGYCHSFPFLPDELRLQTSNHFYPDKLYRGVLWTEAGDNRLFYLGMQNLFYTSPLFFAQGRWTRDVILGSVTLPERAEMLDDNITWRERIAAIGKDVFELVAFQTDHIKQLCKDTKCPYNLDASEQFREVINIKMNNFVDYRKGQHSSIHTKKKSSPAQTDFMHAMDSSVGSYLK